MTGDQVNIGEMNNSNFINGDVFGNVNSTYETARKQPLAEAAAEIQRLLKQLEETNPTATENDQVAYLNIATKLDIKKRTIAALKEAGETAIDEFILENKYLKITKAAVKGWLQMSS
jgi:CHASE3 domain sensor protein